MGLSRKPGPVSCFAGPMAAWEDDDDRAERLNAERHERRQQEISAAHGMHPDTLRRETLTRRQLAKEVGEAMRAAGPAPSPRRIPSVSEDAFDELGEVVVEIDEEYAR
jgi:hypothetical protein